MFETLLFPLASGFFLPLVNPLFKRAESVPVDSKGEVTLLKFSVVEGFLIWSS